jgi:lysozyme
MVSTSADESTLPDRGTGASAPQGTSAPGGASTVSPAGAATPPIATPQTNPTPESVHDATSDRVAKKWKLSEDGLRFMAVCESGVLNGKFLGLPVENGYILEVYNDSKGNPTVGMGHKVLPSDNLKVGAAISVKQAEAFARKDLADSENAVNNSVNVPLHQYEYDALVSITFNTGVGGARRLFEKVNEANYATVPITITTYRARGIEWRRELESRLFQASNYDATHNKTPTHHKDKGQKHGHHKAHH